MCGLIYKQSFTGKPVNNFILDQFDQQKSRGRQGFGLFNGRHLVHAAVEDRILEWIAKDKNDSSMIMFHHRMPTSTINVRQTAHPFSTKDYFGDVCYVLIHNGHISNSSELRTKHKELGITYHSVLEDDTFTDSEALLWDFALMKEGKQTELTARGGNAFICMKLVKGKPTNLFFARNFNPLYMERDSEGLSLSSEAHGDFKSTKGILITNNTQYNWNYATQRLTKKAMTVPNVVYQSNYSHNYSKRHWDTKTKAWVDDDDNYKKYEDYNHESWSQPLSSAWLPKNTNHFSKQDKKRIKKLRRRLEKLQAEWDNDRAKKDQERHEVVDRIVASALSNVERRSEALKAKADPVTDQGNIKAIEDRWEPGFEAINSKCMAYLAGSGGNFSKAYWRLKADYEVLGGQKPSVERSKQLKTMKAAMEKIDDDPEFIDASSISSLWEALWKNRQALNEQQKLLVA